MELKELKKKKITELYEIAKELEIPNYSSYKKNDLILKSQAPRAQLLSVFR